MAGLMLQAVRHIRPGVFLRVGDHFGRVSEQGILHTEIQAEERNLTTLPNLYLVSNPVTVVRSSGTIISASESLAYDIPRKNRRSDSRNDSKEWSRPPSRPGPKAEREAPFGTPASADVRNWSMIPAVTASRYGKWEGAPAPIVASGATGTVF